MFTLSLAYIKNNIRSSAFAILGIAISTTVLVMAVGIANGLSQNTVKSMLFISPHIKMKSNFGIIKNYDELTKNVEKREGVKCAYPKVTGKGILKFASFRGTVAEGIGIEGFNDKDLLKMEFDQKVDDGSIDFSDKASALVGKELADSLELKVGNKFKIVSHENKDITVNLVGTFTTGFYEYDSNFIIIPIDTAKVIFAFPGANEIDIKVEDVYRAEIISEKISEEIGFTNTSWFKMNNQLLKGISLEKSVMILLLSLILIVSGFVISVVVSNTVRDKVKEIGIMRAMGFSRKQIITTFLSMGVVFGLFGIIISGCLSLGLILFIKNVSFKTINEVYYIPDKIPFLISVKEVFYILIGAKLIIFIASLFPSIKAAGLDPVRSLRVE